MSPIQQFVKLCAERRVNIGVVGDSMVDEYYYATANRVSPEFPIPVVQMHSDQPSERLPGGAANVCYQFSRLNADAKLISVLNADALDVMDHHGINSTLSVVLPGATVPVKQRFYQGDMPLSRHDLEDSNFGLSDTDLYESQFKLRNGIRPVEGGMDVLILSDYDKGVFVPTEGGKDHSECVKRWWLYHTKTIVDPKKGPAIAWHGCTVFKPNAEEALRLSGRTEWRDQVDYFLKEVGCESVVITQGGSGVVGYDGESREYFEIASKPTKARSVIGAGDCFCAFLATAIAHGMRVRDAAEVAFKAGAVYVQNIHNRPLGLYDLMRHDDPIAAKYLPPEGDGTLVFANGCFDLLHPGHLETLRFAKRQGDRLVVALNDDESIGRLKGPDRPIMTLNERMAMVAALECVDFVTSFGEDTPLACIERLKPNVIVKGGDYHRDQVVGNDLAHVVLSPTVEGISTTAIINRLVDRSTGRTGQ